MEQTLTPTLYTCRYCLKELPAEAFYPETGKSLQSMPQRRL